MATVSSNKENLPQKKQQKSLIRSFSWRHSNKRSKMESNNYDVGTAKENIQKSEDMVSIDSIDEVDYPANASQGSSQGMSDVDIDDSIIDSNSSSKKRKKNGVWQAVKRFFKRKSCKTSKSFDTQHEASSITQPQRSLSDSNLGLKVGENIAPFEEVPETTMDTDSTPKKAKSHDLLLSELRLKQKTSIDKDVFSPNKQNVTTIDVEMKSSEHDWPRSPTHETLLPGLNVSRDKIKIAPRHRRAPTRRVIAAVGKDASSNEDDQEKNKNKEGKFDQEKVEKERLQQKRFRMEKLENEKLELEKIEQKKLELEKIEQKKLELERLEIKRLEKEKLELERLEKEQFNEEKFEKKLRNEKIVIDEMLEDKLKGEQSSQNELYTKRRTLKTDDFTNDKIEKNSENDMEFDVTEEETKGLIHQDQIKETIESVYKTKTTEVQLTSIPFRILSDVQPTSSMDIDIIGDGTVKKESVGDGTEEQPSVGHGTEEQPSVGHGIEKHIVGDGTEEQPSVGHGTEEQPSVGDGIEEQQSVGHGTEEQPSVSHGIEEKHIVGGGTEEQPSVGHGTEEQPSVGHGTEEQPSVGHGTEEQPSVGHGTEEQPSVGHGTEEQQSVGHGTEEQQSVGDGTEEQHVVGHGTEEQHVVGHGTEEQHIVGHGTEEQHIVNQGTEEQHIAYCNSIPSSSHMVADNEINTKNNTRKKLNSIDEQRFISVNKDNLQSPVTSHFSLSDNVFLSEGEESHGKSPLKAPFDKLKNNPDSNVFETVRQSINVSQNGMATVIRQRPKSLHEEIKSSQDDSRVDVAVLTKAFERSSKSESISYGDRKKKPDLPPKPSLFKANKSRTLERNYRFPISKNLSSTSTTTVKSTPSKPSVVATKPAPTTRHSTPAARPKPLMEPRSSHASVNKENEKMQKPIDTKNVKNGVLKVFSSELPNEHLKNELQNAETELPSFWARRNMFSPQQKSSNFSVTTAEKEKHKPPLIPIKTDYCAVCGKKVYQMEKYSVKDFVVHKACLKCSVCKRLLSVGNFIIHQNKIYCKLHEPRVLKLL